MPSCTLYVFSGSGNTDYMAKKIKEQFKKKNFETDIQYIDKLRKAPPTNVEYIGIGFPVYGGTIPKNVQSFLEMFPKSQKTTQKAFVFATYSKTPYNAIQNAANFLYDTNYHVLRSRGIKMPNTYTISNSSRYNRLPKEYEIKLIYDAANQVKSYVDEILVGREEIEATWGFLGGIATALMGSIFNSMTAPSLAKKLYVNEKCNSCKLCVKWCPVRSIKMEENKPVFLEHCINCSRCYNYCPRKAIVSPDVGTDEYKYQMNDFKPPEVNDIK